MISYFKSGSRGRILPGSWSWGTPCVVVGKYECSGNGISLDFVCYFISCVSPWPSQFSCNDGGWWGEGDPYEPCRLEFPWCWTDLRGSLVLRALACEVCRNGRPGTYLADLSHKPRCVNSHCFCQVRGRAYLSLRRAEVLPWIGIDTSASRVILFEEKCVLFWMYPKAFKILVPQPGIELTLGRESTES